MPSIRSSRKNHTERSAGEGHQLGPALGTQPGPPKELLRNRLKRMDLCNSSIVVWGGAATWAPNDMLQRTGGSAAVCHVIVQAEVGGGSTPAAEHEAIPNEVEIS
jgi:hypothetical protein